MHVTTGYKKLGTWISFTLHSPLFFYSPLQKFHSPWGEPFTRLRSTVLSHTLKSNSPTTFSVWNWEGIVEIEINCKVAITVVLDLININSNWMRLWDNFLWRVGSVKCSDLCYRSGPSPGFRSRGANNHKGAIFKKKYWMYAATGGPNMK